MADNQEDNPNAPETHDIRINAKQGPDPNKRNDGNFLTKKMGPLPVYGWFIVVIAGIVLYRYYQNRNSAANATVPDSGITPSGAPTTPDLPTNQPTTPPGAPQNNLQWLTDAENALRRLGYNPQLVQTSLQRYLAGEQLDPREEAVIETAINLVGQPPIGGTFGQEAPPAHKPKPKPKHHPKTPNEQAQDALETLRRHHFGTHNPIRFPTPQ